MKVVDGQLALLEFFSDFSRVSHSYASEDFREFVSRVAESQKTLADVVPRWIQPKPFVSADGTVSGDFVEPFLDAGRIVKASA